MEYDVKFLARHLGKVVAIDDPKMIGRVKVTVPGLLEPASGWAFPIGGSQSSGAQQRGSYDVPPLGSTVVVSFLSGDPDLPCYEGAPRGLDELLSATPDTPAHADKVKVYESDGYLIVLNSVSGSEQLLISDKNTGNQISMTPTKVTVVAPNIEIGADGLGTAPLVNGVVLASGVDPFTGATYGALGSASLAVTAKKGP